MRRIQSILIVLLFVLAGNLYQQQTSAQLRVLLDDGISFLSQHTAQEQGNGCNVHHSIFAPEVTNGIQSHTQDHKTLTKHQPSPTLCPPHRPCASHFANKRSVVLHPNSVDYYIYTLEKIVI